MSLLTSFNTGVLGMTAAQSGLNTTAHNLSNTATQGYTRQQNIQKDIYYHTHSVTDKAKLQVGYGTTVAAIRQIRDQFLDKEYRLELSRQSFYEIQFTTAQEIEDILGEMEGVEFEAALTGMWETVESLSTNPESITNRELFIAEAEAFLEKAKNAYDSLREYQVNLNSQLESQVYDINEIAREIADLNFKIAEAEASNQENANDYRDSRNLLLDRLAEYTHFDAYEDYTGVVTVRIDNAPLVEDTMVYRMKCELMEDSRMYNIVWENSGFGDVYDLQRAYSSESKTDTGSLLGLITARGLKNGYYTDIPANPTKEQLDKYNDTTGNCLLTKMEAQLDLLVHKVVKSINDAFAPNETVDLSSVTDADDQAVLADVLANGNTVKVLNATQCPVGADDDATLGTELFVRKAQGERYEKYTGLKNPISITDADGNPVEVTHKEEDGTYSLYVYIEEDASDVNTLYTLQNLEINQKVLENYSYLPVKANPALGMTEAYDMDVCANILAAWRAEDTMLDPNELSKYSVDTFYDAMVGNLGTQGSVWKSIVENQTQLTESIEDKRQQIAGVSTEEEMTSLLMYQHAYNAASRYITTIDQMLEHLIMRLG